MDKFVVEVKQPEGVGVLAMNEHIATAVRRWGGGGPSDDPFFDIGDVVCRKVLPGRELLAEDRLRRLEKTLSTMERELKEKTELLFRLEQEVKVLKNDERIGAWHSVFATLREEVPGFTDKAGTGEQCAILAIRELAAFRRQQDWHRTLTQVAEGMGHRWQALRDLCTWTHALCRQQP